MKYLCLICAEPASTQAMSTPARRWHQEHLEFIRDIQQRGNLLSAQQLQPAAAAVTLRVRDATLSVTDGPFAATKEQISG